MLEGIGHGKQKDIHVVQSLPPRSICMAQIHTRQTHKCRNCTLPLAESDSMEERKPLFYFSSSVLCTGHDTHHDSRSLLSRVIQAFRSLHKIRRLRVRNIDERLRISVGQREPGTLHLDHDAVSTAECVIHILHREIDFFHLAWSKCFRLFKAVTKLSAEGFAAHQLLVPSHCESSRKHIRPRLVSLFGLYFIYFAVRIIRRINI